MRPAHALGLALLLLPATPSAVASDGSPTTHAEPCDLKDFTGYPPACVFYLWECAQDPPCDVGALLRLQLLGSGPSAGSWGFER